jgi:hypothetical protein
MSALSRTSRITLAVLVALFALYFLARLRYAGKAPVKLQAQDCDSALWDHIHQKERLDVIEACTAVEGRVVSLRRNSDGDLHIALDPDQRSVLNLVNLIHAHGDLVVEIICEHTPDAAADKVACGTFHSVITLPNVGDRIRVTGAYVTDRDNGWNEVHPVTRLEVLR